MTTKASWFEVDRKGLAAIAARRNKRFILRELIQNAWDEASTVVNVSITKPNGSRKCVISVEDDSPQGFANLSHAYTLFAPSAKVTDAQKRGRFNFGEKLVLALCSEASIETTTGTVYFEEGETRRSGRKKRAAGSQFVGTITLGREEVDDLIADARRMIPPVGKRTIVNGDELQGRTAIREIRHILTTEIAKEDGTLRSEMRFTMLRIYEPLEGEKAMLFEMGIPVVETGDRWHVDIGQKVPLNMERDNVSPAYLRDVRVAVANATHDMLTSEDANSSWARDALADWQCKPETTTALVKLRFGDKAVVFDPSDLEANSNAVAKGYTIVHGSQLNAEEWQRVRDAKAMLPAGQVCPTPKAFTPGGAPLKTIEEDNWTPGMLAFVGLAREVATVLLGQSYPVTFADDKGWPFKGCIEVGGIGKRLYVNVPTFGGIKAFEDFASEDKLEFLIHEFAHEHEGNHLSDRYHAALSGFGAKLVRLALSRPDIFGRQS